MFLFVSSILLSCNKELLVTTLNYFKATVGSKTLNCISTDEHDSPYGNISTASSHHGAYYYYDYASKMVHTTYQYNTQLSLGVTMYNMNQNTNANNETANFNVSFDSKPVNFISVEQKDNFVKGVSVEYYTDNGEYYTTLMGNQDNSSITYDSSVAYNSGNIQKQTVIGKVNCKLYNYNNPTDVIELSNGTFKLTFQEFD